MPDPDQPYQVIEVNIYFNMPIAGYSYFSFSLSFMR